MLNNFLYLRKSIEIILYQNKDLEHLFITENEWQRLERYKKFSKYFENQRKDYKVNFFKLIILFFQ